MVPNPIATLKKGLAKILEKVKARDNLKSTDKLVKNK